MCLWFCCSGRLISSSFPTWTIDPVDLLQSLPVALSSAPVSVVFYSYFYFMFFSCMYLLWLLSLCCCDTWMSPLGIHTGRSDLSSALFMNAGYRCGATTERVKVCLSWREDSTTCSVSWLVRAGGLRSEAQSASLKNSESPRSLHHRWLITAASNQLRPPIVYQPDGCGDAALITLLWPLTSDPVWVRVSCRTIKTEDVCESYWVVATPIGPPTCQSSLSSCPSAAVTSL